MLEKLVFIFVLVWVMGFIVQWRLENFIDAKEAKDCTNCIRYYDTIVCKCKNFQENPSAFLYPTDVTPDINLQDINLTKK